MEFRHLPVIVFSFNRPDYLRATLVSLREAIEAGGMAGPVVLFQDGARNPHSGQERAAPAQIAACVAAFRAVFPQGVVFASAVNLGIGLNVDRGERWVFETQGYPAGLFFEDDMVLAPHYFRALAGLYRLASAEPRIAMFAAYGADGRSTLARQRAEHRRVGAMHHNWAFGLTRAGWLARETLTAAYTAALQGCDYRDRPLERIAAWHVRLGWPPMPTSQDIARAIAFNTLGLARVSSLAICARNIGAVGQHYTPEEFRRLGLGDVALLDEAPPEAEWTFDALAEAELSEILAEDRATLLRQRLGPEPFMGSEAFVEAARILRAIGPDRLVRRLRGPLAAVSGLYPDRWCHPAATLVFDLGFRLRTLTVEGVAAQHLPPATTLAAVLNGSPAGAKPLQAGQAFTLDLVLPVHLDGLEKTLKLRCSVNADPYSVGFNEDRRALSFLLLRLVLMTADGNEIVITGEQVAAGSPLP
jgi:hypothetical protein